MKAVMLSIQPKWCELIASGEKMVEVRKTAPKLQTSFKCYIYATMPKTKSHPARVYHSYIMPVSGECGSGKVIGEFICDKIDEIYCDRLDNGVGDTSHYYTNEGENEFMAQCCVSEFDLERYLGYKGAACRVGYGWHISDLKIYDEPKELSEFRRPLDMPTCGYSECGSYEHPHCKWLNLGCEKRKITRSPQSWCYVEEI